MLAAVGLPVVLVVLGALVLWLGTPTPAEAFNPTHPCQYCHGSHRSSGAPLIRGGSIDDLCLSCHGVNGSSRLRVVAHYVAPSGVDTAQTQGCAQCHALHGSVPGGAKKTRPQTSSPFRFLDGELPGGWKR